MQFLVTTIQTLKSYTLHSDIISTSPRCSGSSKVNFQYARLKLDIDKLKYGKWSKYRFKQSKCRVWGTLKNQKRAKNEFVNDNN